MRSSSPWSRTSPRWCSGLYRIYRLRLGLKVYLVSPGRSPSTIMVLHCRETKKRLRYDPSPNNGLRVRKNLLSLFFLWPGGPSTFAWRYDHRCCPCLRQSKAGFGWCGNSSTESKSQTSLHVFGPCATVSGAAVPSNVHPADSKTSVLSTISERNSNPRKALNCPAVRALWKSTKWSTYSKFAPPRLSILCTKTLETTFPIVNFAAKKTQNSVLPTVYTRSRMRRIQLGLFVTSTYKVRGSSLNTMDLIMADKFTFSHFKLWWMALKPRSRRFWCVIARTSAWNQQFKWHMWKGAKELFCWHSCRLAKNTTIGSLNVLNETGCSSEPGTDDCIQDFDISAYVPKSIQPCALRL